MKKFGMENLVWNSGEIVENVFSEFYDKNWQNS